MKMKIEGEGEDEDDENDDADDDDGDDDDGGVWACLQYSTVHQSSPPGVSLYDCLLTLT